MAGLRSRAVQFMYPFLLFLISFTPGSLGLSCTTRPAAPIDSARPGDRIATIPASRIDILGIVKSDPATGDGWSVELRRSHPELPPAFQWELHSSVPDARADGDLVRHILDSIEALKLASVPRPSPLEASGLKPPRFALRWAAAKGTEELELGAPAVEPGQIYALVPALSFARPVKVQGSLPRVLAELGSFDRIRQHSWSATGADDFDELELKRRGKSLFYAQRERDRWTDRNHRRVKKDASRILSMLTLAPIREFLDDPAAAREEASRIQGSRDYQAIFTDRAGQKTILTVSRSGDGTSAWALCSARPGAPFRLDRTVLEAWEF